MSESEPITVESLERAFAKAQEWDQADAERRAAKAKAWADLDLDWDAMTTMERHRCHVAFASPAVHPEMAAEVEAIVRRHRRNSPVRP